MNVRSLPRFATQEGLTTTLFGTFVLDILSEIGANKAVSSSDVELMEQKGDRPICILTVEDAEDCLTTAIGLEPHQFVTEYAGKIASSRLSRTCGDHQEN